MKPLIARRPVFDAGERIFAYDLAVHGGLGASGFYEEVSPEQLIANVFLDVGIDRVADGHDVLVTVDGDILLGGSLPSLPTHQVIVQIPAAAGIHPGVALACADLVSSGYRLAVEVDQRPPSTELLQMANVIKVDLTTVKPNELAQVATRLRGFSARLLATNVQHKGERDVCVKLGFDLFEGFRFSTPETLTRRDIGVELLNAFRVLKLVRDPKASDLEIEELLRRDVALSYKLLRMVNSAASGGRGISSIGHALRMLGREQVARWLAILLATDTGGEGVRAELVQQSLVRARMCELLADVAGMRDARGALFLVGMLSVLDQLLEIPMDSLCDAMQLAGELRDALLKRTGRLGRVLHVAESYVGGAWQDVDTTAAELSVNTTELVPAYFDALGWAATHRTTGEPASSG